MNSFLNLFRKRTSPSAEAHKRWIQGFRAFESGKKYVVERRDQQAVDCFDTAVECGYENADIFSLRGTCLQSLEWHIDAIEDFSKAISLEPNNCNYYFSCAMSKCSAGDQQGFLSDIQDAIRLSKIDNTLNRNYNQGAKDMGWQSITQMYQAQLLAETPDFIVEKNLERMRSRGRRPRPVVGA